ncbi:MAG: hypothetical protein K6G84_01655 [Lachnospiraceae bacterium]|nr:hypothetical protein [Lachnospiraceae bacterium]
MWKWFVFLLGGTIGLASLFCGIWYVIEAVRSNIRVEATLIEIKERYRKAGTYYDLIFKVNNNDFNGKYTVENCISIGIKKYHTTESYTIFISKQNHIAMLHPTIHFMVGMLVVLFSGSSKGSDISVIMPWT